MQRRLLIQNEHRRAVVALDGEMEVAGRDVDHTSLDGRAVRRLDDPQRRLRGQPFRKELREHLCHVRHHHQRRAKIGGQLRDNVSHRGRAAGGDADRHDIGAESTGRARAG